MAGEAVKPYALANLILDYLRTLIWPIALVVVVLVYQSDIRKILTERQFEVLGLRVGERIREVDKNVRQEIVELRDLVKDLENRPATASREIKTRITSKIASLERNLNRELNQLQRLPVTAPSNTQATVPRHPDGQPVTRGSAKYIEIRGFDALLARDIKTAIKAFTSAFELSPNYHNVAEIRRLLVKQERDLPNPRSPAWTKLYRTILTRYSWGISETTRQAMKRALS